MLLLFGKYQFMQCSYVPKTRMTHQSVQTDIVLNIYSSSFKPMDSSKLQLICVQKNPTESHSHQESYMSFMPWSNGSSIDYIEGAKHYLWLVWGPTCTRFQVSTRLILPPFYDAPADRLSVLTEQTLDSVCTTKKMNGWNVPSIHTLLGSNNKYHVTQAYVTASFRQFMDWLRNRYT